MGELMRAGLFDPYLDTLGGGEIYSLSALECFSEHGYEPVLLWPEDHIIQLIEQRLGYEWRGLTFDEIGFHLMKERGNWQAKRRHFRHYDLLFVVSDGSMPWLWGKKNIVHFQVPFHDVKGSSLASQIKAKSVANFICNSFFTKEIVDEEYLIRSQVVYPHINAVVSPEKKENIILAVSRFSKLLHNKRQDVLIDAFKHLCQTGLVNWRLVLVGSVLEADDWVKELRQKSHGYPIEIKTNVDFCELKDWYAKAKIFWHAAGYAVGEEAHPEAVEHFGIAVAKAMAAGAVPVVIGKGGIPEIVEHEVNGLLWEQLAQMEQLTKELISNENRRTQLAVQAMKVKERFSKQRFNQELWQVVNEK